MGDPGARLFNSPLPQPTLPTSCFSSFPPILHHHPKSKNQTILGIGSCWALLRAFPRSLPRARAASLLPPRRSYRSRTAIAVRAG